MIEFYRQIWLVHVGAVTASGTLFFLRGAGLLSGGSWPLSLPVRLLSYAIDTTLLTAALMLMTIVQQYPFVDGWLTVKVLLLLVYIALGVMAFWRARSMAARAAFWGAGLAVFLFIVSVARAHDPLGVLSGLLG